MPAIPRKHQKLFGSSLVPTGNVAVFGSLQAGAPAFSNDLTAIQSLAAWLSGFNGAVVGNRSPAIEDLNALCLLIVQQIAYCLQSGIPEWDASTTYFAGNFVRVGGVIYTSLTDDNTGNDPTSDTNNWQSYKESVAPTGSTAKAWVNFNGLDGSILDSYNVSGIVRTAAGSYTITFATPMANNSYGVIGTCGPSDGGSRTTPAGNNNHVSRDTISTTTQCSVWIPKPDQSFGEDAGVVSVVIY